MKFPALLALAPVGALLAAPVSCTMAMDDAAPSCQKSASMPMAGGQTVVAIAAGNPDFSTLVAAIKAAGLADALSADGPFTVFAPTNAAFAKLSSGTLEDLLKPENKSKLARILTYHVVPAKVLAAEAVKLTTAPTLSGQRLDLVVKGGTLTVDGAAVTKADIVGSNGVIHVIDTVLLPSGDDLATTASKAGSFGTLLAAAKAAGLVEALKGDQSLTVLAPTDEAFAKLPKDTLAALLKPENKDALAGILKLHIIAGRVFSDQALKAGTAATLSGESVKFAVEGGAAKVNNARIVKTDIDASNGVIHVIDTVLLPASMPKLSRAGATMPRAGSAFEIATLAIDKGAPMFNDGQPAACAAIYEVACRGILAMDAVSAPTRDRLHAAMTAAAAESHDGRKAWALRHGLDAVLQEMPLASR
jgi:transforming growth factor-beta-induced protein